MKLKFLTENTGSSIIKKIFKYFLEFGAVLDICHVGIIQKVSLRNSHANMKAV